MICSRPFSKTLNASFDKPLNGMMAVAHNQDWNKFAKAELEIDLLFGYSLAQPWQDSIFTAENSQDAFTNPPEWALVYKFFGDNTFRTTQRRSTYYFTYISRKSETRK